MTHEEFQEQMEKQIGGFGGRVSLVAEELDTGERFTWDEHRSVTPASTIKLPILCAAYHWSQRGGPALDQRIPVRAGDRVGGNGVLFQLEEGLQPTLRDLMKLMIVISDNMATNMVMDAVGTGRIKEFLEEKGLGVIWAERKMLDPEGMKRGQVNCVTADALSCVLKGLANKTLLCPAHCEEAVEILLDQQCNNKMPAKVIPRWDLVFKGGTVRMAHKTGEMPGIEHDIGIVFTPNSRFVLVLLTQEGDNDAAIELVSRLAREFTDYFDPAWKTGAETEKTKEVTT